MMDVQAQPDFSQQVAALSIEHLETRWYAAHTCARHEKQVARQLSERKVEHFLPLYETVHRWKDRRVKVQLPLFPGYLFVRIALQNRRRVLETPGVVRLVASQGTPAPLPSGEIEALRCGLSNHVRAEPHPYLRISRRVRVKSGPLAGAEGTLVRKKDNWRLMLSVDLIKRSVILEVDAADVEPVLTGEPPRGTPASKKG